MKKILVPTDFSELSDFAIDFAIDLANNAISEVEIVHFMDLPLGVDFEAYGDITKEITSKNETDNLRLIKANKEKIQALNDRFSDSEIKVKAFIYGGGFLKGLEHIIKKHHVDMVVIGTSGQEGLKEFFSGNHAEQLIENLKIPVITLKEPVKMEEIKHVVLGIDMQDEPYQPWKMLHLTRRVLECFDATIHLVNVVPHKSAYTEEVRRKLNDVAEELGLEHYEVAVIPHRDDFSGLVQFADKIDARMICVFTHARPGLYRFFQRSFASDLTMVSDMPVLVLNKRNVTKMEVNE